MLNESGTCWNVIPACWILIQLMFRDMCAFWREIWIDGRRNVVIALRCKRCRCNCKTSKKRRKNRKTWTRDWLKNRNSLGTYYALFAELRYHILTHSQSSIPIQPQFQSPCWAFPPSRVTPNSKTIGGRRSTSGNLLRWKDSSSLELYSVQQHSTALQHVEWHISTFNNTWYTVNISWAHLLLNKCWTVYH